MFFKYSPESFAHPDGIQGHWGETHCYRKGEIKKKSYLSHNDHKIQCVQFYFPRKSTQEVSGYCNNEQLQFIGISPLTT